MGLREDAEKILDIDEHDLINEWLGQAKLYFRMSAILADARMELDRAKADLDLVDAEVDQGIRRDPERYSLAKVTEPAIAALVLADKRHKKAFERWVVAKHDVAVAQAAESGADHRKRALESLTQLKLSDFYAEPKLPKGMNQKVGGMKADRAFGEKRSP